MELTEKKSKINFNSFLWHSVFLALASNFMDVDTIIPSMLIKAGGNSIHLGVLTAIMLGGTSLFQLVFAVLVGIIPESGPHLVFVTLFAAGTLPFGILLASSIVQDGHGMLPMLAVSRRGFILVKLINILVGLIVGLILMIFI